VLLLIQELNEAGCSVQLKHVPTETSWEDLVDHGYVATYDAAGKQLARRDGFQHNRNLRNGGARDTSAIAALVKETKDGLGAKKEVIEAPALPEDASTAAAAGAAAA